MDFTDSYKKIDALKDLECYNNILSVGQTLNKWASMKSTPELQNIISAFLDIQWYLIDLKRQRDLALRGILEYKKDKLEAQRDMQEAIDQLKRYENKHLPRD